MPDRRRATGRVPSGADREPASRRTPAPAPPPHAAALTLQAAAGNRAVQRLIAVDSARLYYDRTRLGLGNDADRAKENAWKRGITSNTGMAPNEIAAQNFVGLRGIGGWDGFVLGATAAEGPALHPGPRDLVRLEGVGGGRSPAR